jgi:ribosomal protein S18 acetylase RimI-like enzyme
MVKKLNKTEIYKASTVLADAFKDDPLWNKLFSGEKTLDKKFRNFFEVPLRFCMKYGEVWSNSDEFEGIAAWLPGKLSYMTLWQMIQSGAIIPAMKMGSTIGRTMQKAFVSVDSDRKESMKGKDFIYLFVIGVSSKHQGKGFGGKLLKSILEMADKEKLHIYLETETEENVNLYEHFGFKTIKKINLPVFNLPFWEMVRQPK